ncbi:MAG: CvpA family protein [Clostridia bacterium]|nr:CvpA family protein [Clostridia bacterium]
MNPNIIPMVLTISFLGFVAFGFLLGLLKGAMKSMVDIVAAITCAVLALPITKILVTLLIKPATILLFTDWLISILPEGASEYVIMVQQMITNDTTKETAADIVELIGALPVLILSPIIYILIFAILCIIVYLVAFIIKILACPKTKGVPLRLVGGGLGALTCAVIFVALASPLLGYVNMADDTIDYYLEISKKDEQPSSSNVGTGTDTELVQAKEMSASEDNTQASDEADGDEGEFSSSTENDEKIDTSAIKDALEIANDYISPIKSNVASILAYSLGGRAIFNTLTTTEVADVKINLQTEVNGMVDLADVAIDFVNTSPKHYGKEQTDAIDRLNASIEESEYLPLILSKVVSFVANEYYQGHSIMGVEKPNLGDRFNPTFDRILAVLKNTDSDDIRQDLRTISNIANGAVDTGIIDEVTSSEIDAWKIAENDEFIAVVLVELYKNPRTYNMVPYLTGALTNYAHDIYNEINDDSTKADKFDYTNYNEEQLKIEAENISNTVKEIHTFIDSTDFSAEDGAKEIIVNSDLAALGRALEYMRDGMFTDRMFKILFHALLYSEAADELGIVDDTLIEKAENPNSDIDKLLVSRQNVLRLAIAIQEKKSKDERTELMHSVVEDILQEDETVSSLISKDNLISVGMSTSEAESVEVIVNSMIDGAHKCEFDSEEHKAEEIEKTEKIIDAVSNTVLGESEDSMFKTGEGDASTTDMTAQEFVDRVLDSKLSSSMVNNAVVDENGEVKEDPYKIQNSLSDSDKDEITQAINNTYAKEDLTEEQKQALDSLATIFGVPQQ